MHRRRFLSGLALSGLSAAFRTGASATKRVAVTMDDPRTDRTPRLSAKERNDAILATLEGAKVRAALFVCGMRVDDRAGGDLLEEWNRRDHLLGNHTYTHPYLPSADYTSREFVDDIQRGERVVARFSRFAHLFRYPFLKEGDTVEKRDSVRTFLRERGYRVGHVTIDASDWYVDLRMAKRLEQDPDVDLSPYRDYYLQHLLERAAFYGDLATRVVGRSIPHTLLIHHSLLNALFLGDVLRAFEKSGWTWIDADAAFDDEVFSQSPDILPAGESLLWALAKQTGRYEDRLRYPGEDGRYEEAAMDRLGL